MASCAATPEAVAPIQAERAKKSIVSRALTVSPVGLRVRLSGPPLHHRMIREEASPTPTAPSSCRARAAGFGPPAEMRWFGPGARSSRPAHSNRIVTCFGASGACQEGSVPGRHARSAEVAPVCGNAASWPVKAGLRSGKFFSQVPAARRPVVTPGVETESPTQLLRPDSCLRESYPGRESDPVRMRPTPYRARPLHPEALLCQIDPGGASLSRSMPPASGDQQGSTPSACVAMLPGGTQARRK